MPEPAPHATVQNNLQTGLLEHHEQPIQKRLHKRRPVPILRLTSNQRTMTEQREVPETKSVPKIEPLPRRKSRHALIPEEHTPGSAKDQTTKYVSIPRESRNASARQCVVLRRYSMRPLRTLTGVYGGTMRPVRQGHIRRSSINPPHPSTRPLPPSSRRYSHSLRRPCSKVQH
ncbi:hypothetical protein BSL78_04245 [Apostichopus japonicus]|uniref:Uncharacterized protein n=1 Tax=Stichopus japonicus TaxID=307972 RepID=A0A2G8LF27_STIJA|nr:hypothetical protein BSL78_04245 [Apostichopus japonicus]